MHNLHRSEVIILNSASWYHGARVVASVVHDIRDTKKTKKKNRWDVGKVVYR